MSLKQIIKQTEALNKVQQKRLASYFVLKYLNPDKNLMQLFDDVELEMDDKKNYNTTDFYKLINQYNSIKEPKLNTNNIFTTLR